MYTIPQTFARRELDPTEAEFVVLGIPFDSSESYRTGSRHGPHAIREASRDLEDYDMELGIDLLNLKIADKGDLEVSYGNYDETRKRAVKTIRDSVDGGAVPLLLGGEHSITLFGAEVVGDAFYVIYDAHLDYREDYLENPYSHASVTRRLAEIVGLENILIVGVRSASFEELEKAESDGLKYIRAEEFHENKAEAIDLIKKETAGRSLYLSIDLDALDPSEARGVCNPEPGGLYYREVVESFGFLKSCNLKGMDLTELSPAYDPYSQVLAAKVIFKALALSKT